MSQFVINGPEDTSGIPDESVGKLFMDAFNTFDKNIAVINIDSGESFTYKQLYQLSQNLAASLRLLGITKNDNLALVAENSHEFLVVYLASLFLAAPVHLINPKYTQYELKHILSLSTPVAVFCTKKSRYNVTQAVQKLNFVKILMCTDMIKSNSGSFQVEENINTEEHPAVICNSSGTTGFPKGVMLSHSMLRLPFVYARDPDFYDMRAEKKVPQIVPFFHMYGLNIVNAALYAGSTILAFDHFDPEIFLETIQKHKPEQLLLVPTVINFLLTSPLVQKYDLSSVKQIHSGGSSLSEEDAKSLRQKFNLEKIGVGYGMTESGVVTHTSNSNGSVGKVLCGNQLKIINLKTGQALPALQNGEICFRGHLMKGYVNDIEKTNEVIDSEGFLHTGDLGYYDENSLLYVIGRIKDIIKYKSLQVSPVELENILKQHEGIKDVAVVGKPDRRYGELPTACVVKENGSGVTEQEICDYLAEFVSEGKRLHGGVRFVETIPRNSLGKILRKQVAEQIMD